MAASEALQRMIRVCDRRFDCVSNKRGQVMEVMHTAESSDESSELEVCHTSCTYALPLSSEVEFTSAVTEASVSNFGVQELPQRTGTSLTDVFPVQVEWEDGYLLPPERPGLGIEFDEEAAQAHPYQEVKPPLLQRADGALTNW